MNVFFPHFILAEMCGNRFFEALIYSFVELTLRVVQIAAEPVLAGNPAKATLVMKKHATEFGKILMKMEKTFRKKKALSSV
jgi:DNA-binding FadR family transcriptional regulator